MLKVNPAHFTVLFRSFWSQVSRYFTSDEARQIISFVAFYLCRTPFDTSGVYTLLSYTEFVHDGYFNVQGGMYKIVEGIEKELRKAGVKIWYNTEITDFSAAGERIEYFTDSNGNKWEADIFAVNADAAVFRGTILKRKNYSLEKLDRMNWTMGSLTIYIGLKCKLEHVHHHNYFLGDNFREYADKVFKNPGVLQKPCYYVNVLSRNNPECAPEGGESIFIVCPVPDLRFKPDWKDRDDIVYSIIDDFSERIGVNIRPEIASLTAFTPLE